MDARTWWLIGGSAVIGLGLAALIVTQTSWFKIRMYAINLKKIFDKHKVQEKAEAVQQLGQNPNPVLAKKPLRELVTAYQGLVTDLEKMKVPPKARDLHDTSLTMHRESLQLYQAVAVGGFRQKALMDKQKRLQQMERTIQEKMEKLYGPMKKPEKK